MERQEQGKSRGGKDGRAKPDVQNVGVIGHWASQEEEVEEHPRAALRDVLLGDCFLYCSPSAFRFGSFPQLLVHVLHGRSPLSDLHIG
eukprot:1742934-Amphidinium_carterae.1